MLAFPNQNSRQISSQNLLPYAIFLTYPLNSSLYHTVHLPKCTLCCRMKLPSKRINNGFDIYFYWIVKALKYGPLLLDLTSRKLYYHLDSTFFLPLTFVRTVATVLSSPSCLHHIHLNIILDFRPYYMMLTINFGFNHICSKVCTKNISLVPCNLYQNFIIAL